MRVIAGTAGGHPLAAPRGQATRPTSDRVREALFAILGPPPPNARVLDLFAGAGTLGIEALSRGAVQATFVDSARAAVTCIRQNLAGVKMADRADVLQMPVHRFAQRLARAPGQSRHHWIFVDPPYAAGADDALILLGQAPVLAIDGTLVVEHDRRSPPEQQYGFLAKFDTRRYGDTELAFYRTNPDAR